MLRILALLLPALIPSWRFFDSIAASPRLEFAELSSADDALLWQEFLPRPQRISPLTRLRKLLLNPEWNEQLFLVSLCERLIFDGCSHAGKDIESRLTRMLGPPENAWLFRVVLISGQDDELILEVVFTSEPISA